MGIVSNSRGVATLAKDACESRGLTVGSSLAIGARAGPADCAASIREFLAEPAMDAVMAYYVDVGGGDPQAVLAALSVVSAHQDKPVVASVLGADGRRVRWTGSSVPNFHFPETCAAVLSRAVERREWLSRALGQRPEFDDVDADAARARVAAWLEDQPIIGPEHRGGWLPTTEAEALLDAFGISFVASEHCSDIERAVSAAAALGDPSSSRPISPRPRTRRMSTQSC
jgi:acetyltransferase